MTESGGDAPTYDELSTIRQRSRYWADIEGVDDGLAETVHAPELPDGAESREVHLSADRAHQILDFLHDYVTRPGPRGLPTRR